MDSAIFHNHVICSLPFQTWFAIGNVMWIGIGWTIFSLLCVFYFRTVSFILSLFSSVFFSEYSEKRKDSNPNQTIHIKKRRRARCCCCCCYFFVIPLSIIERIQQVFDLMPYYSFPMMLTAIWINLFISTFYCWLPVLDENEILFFQWNAFLHYFALAIGLALLIQIIVWAYINCIYRKSLSTLVRISHAFLIVPLLIGPGLMLYTYTEHEVTKEITQ